MTRYRRAPSLTNDAGGARSGLGDRDAGHELVGPPQRRPIADDELLDRQRAPASGAGQLDRGIQRQEHRDAVGGRGSVADVADDRAGVLHLHPADLARCSSQAIEARGQVGAQQVGPGDQRPDRPAITLVRDVPQAGQRCDVEHVVVERLSHAGRIEVRCRRRAPSARGTPEHRARLPTVPAADTKPSGVGSLSQPTDYIVSCASRSSCLLGQVRRPLPSATLASGRAAGCAVTSLRTGDDGGRSGLIAAPLGKAMRSGEGSGARRMDRLGRHPRGRQTGGTRPWLLARPWWPVFPGRRLPIPPSGASSSPSRPACTSPAARSWSPSRSSWSRSMPAANLRMVERAVWRAGRVPEHLRPPSACSRSSRP